MHQNKVHSRLLFLVAALLPSCLAIAANQRLQSDDEAKQALLRLEDRWLASEDDPDVLKNVLADDFIHALPIGLVTKADQLDYLRHRKNPPPKGAKHFEEMHVRVYGDVGIVNGIVVAEVSPAGGVHKTVFTDVFARRHGQWQAVNAQETPFHKNSEPPTP